ncbi:hypothetical protein [Bradyrhizobium pachyrhizi]|uniref:hypothetical protein n=1 Tax=Bradyrhizobium pachyrhizi TaxID=280333 RepID=UPI003D36AC94
MEVRITEAIYGGRLTPIAAKLISAEPDRTGAIVSYRRRGESRLRRMHVGAIVDCTGIVKDPRATANPAVRSLLELGLARVDPLRIGIETDRNCAIIGHERPIAPPLCRRPAHARRVLGNQRNSRHPQPMRRACHSAGSLRRGAATRIPRARLELRL